MKKISQRYLQPFFLFSFGMLALSACNNNNNNNGFTNLEQVNLVANNTTYSPARFDGNFINAWGFDFSPFGPAFISSNGNSICVAYGPLGEERRSPISIPGAGELGINGRPAGVVFNGTDNFFLSDFAPARFIYAGSDGVISAWDAGDAAVVIKDNSSTASYTGIALGTNADADLLYVTNFKEHKIQVYDGAFGEVSLPFADPSLPSTYSPYNIRNIDGLLYVTYAMADAYGNPSTGAGRGYVDVYNTDGTLSHRFISGGKLNAPWGIVKADPDFGDATLHQPDAILVGNYGDGHINAYSQGGSFIGAVRLATGSVSIPGLRQLSFAPDSAVAENGKLFFTAGPNGGQDALYGYIHGIQP